MKSQCCSFLDKEKFHRVAEKYPQAIEFLRRLSGERKLEAEEAAANEVVVDANELVLL